jgi:hypothetical protein
MIAQLFLCNLISPRNAMLLVQMEIGMRVVTFGKRWPVDSRCAALIDALDANYWQFD